MKLFEVAKQSPYQRFMSKVNADCPYFLSHVKMPMYRGLSEMVDFGKYRIRKDRRPMNTPEYAHAIMNMLFERMTGIERLRNQCLFVIGNMREAARYDRPYKVYLPDGGKYIYNPKITDSYVNVFKHRAYVKTIVNWCMSNKISLIESDKFVVLYDYINDKDFEVVSKFTPITITYTETIASFSKKVGEKRLNNLLDALMKNIAPLRGYVISDYKKVPMKAEIMVYGIDHYYAVDTMFRINQ